MVCHISCKVSNIMVILLQQFFNTQLRNQSSARGAVADNMNSPFIN